MKYRFAFFDVDSTLVTIEGIDVLADGNPEIARLTDAAMNGEIPLDQVYAKRLEMIRPSQDRVEQLGATYVASLVEGANGNDRDSAGQRRHRPSHHRRHRTGHPSARRCTERPQTSTP